MYGSYRPGIDELELDRTPSRTSLAPSVTANVETTTHAHFSAMKIGEASFDYNDLSLAISCNVVAFDPRECLLRNSNSPVPFFIVADEIPFIEISSEGGLYLHIG